MLCYVMCYSSLRLVAYDWLALDTFVHSLLSRIYYLRLLLYLEYCSYPYLRVHSYIQLLCGRSFGSFSWATKWWNDTFIMCMAIDYCRSHACHPTFRHASRYTNTNTITTAPAAHASHLSKDVRTWYMIHDNDNKNAFEFVHSFCFSFHSSFSVAGLLCVESSQRVISSISPSDAVFVVGR